MTDYDLYYWPVPFRGQFVRALLAYAGKSWTEADAGTISDLLGAPVADAPIPFMGPPMLMDRAAGVAVAQMPAIVLYLGETLGMMPSAPAERAWTMKVVNDANDVIDDLTLDGGRQMWTAERWREFVPRLKRWMAIWEDTGRRHGLTMQSGFLLGGEATGIADIVTAVLWSTMTTRLAPLAALLDDVAPMTAALARRVAAEAPLAELATKSSDAYGDTYCGGQIEASLRKVLASA
jgi:glutathione S-transferase